MNGVHIVDLSDSVAGAYCARVLAVSGARVVRVVPPAGDPLSDAPPLVPDAGGTLRSALAVYLNYGKDTVTLDLGTEAGQHELDRLLQGADAVISTHDGKPDAALALYERAVRANQRVIHTAVTPFGLTGPYRSYRSSDFTDWAISGYLSFTGLPERGPLQGGGPWTGYATGLTAAVGTAVALRQSRRTGRGQLVDVGLLEAMAGLHQWSIVLYTHQGVVKRRAGNRHAESYHPMGLQPCADGWVCVGVSTVAQWQNFCLAIDMPELLADPRFATGADRFDHADDLDAAIAPWLRARTCVEVVARLQEFRVPASPVLTLTDTLREPQLQVRGFWVPAPEFGPDARMPVGPFQLGSRRSNGGGRTDLRTQGKGTGGTDPLPAASPLSESNTEQPAALATVPRRLPAADPRLPLAGLRVLELSIAWAGPLAGRWLADLGAEVIKVEHMTARGGAAGAAARAMARTWTRGMLAPPPIRAGVFPNADPGDQPWNRQGIWNKMNRSKRGLCIDLKHPDGAEVFRRLVRVTDIVLDNYSPRAMPGLGFGYDDLKQINPRVIAVSLSGYGHTGPYRDRVSWGPILEAHSGLAAATGYGDGMPVKLGHAYPDPIGGMSGTAAILAALWNREQAGEGCFIDLSQYEGYLSIAGELLLAASVTGRPPQAIGNRHSVYAPQGIYPCAGDDQWLALSVRSDREWLGLVEASGIAVLRDPAYRTAAGRRAAHDTIDDALAAWTRDKNKHLLMAQLQGAGVTATAVFTNADLVTDPQIQARGFVVEYEQGDSGRLGYPGYPIHFSEPMYIEPRGAPALGGDNEHILTEILGYEQEQVEKLNRDGVIGTRPPET